MNLISVAFISDDVSSSSACIVRLSLFYVKGDNLLIDLTVGLVFSFEFRMIAHILKILPYSMSTVLMSRFILNLREVYMSTTSVVSTLPRSEHSTFISELRFASVSVGTFGAPMSVYTDQEESSPDADSMYLKGLSVEDMPWILGSVCISDDPVTVGLEDDM